MPWLSYTHSSFRPYIVSQFALNLYGFVLCNWHLNRVEAYRHNNKQSAVCCVQFVFISNVFTISYVFLFTQMASATNPLCFTVFMCFYEPQYMSIFPFNVIHNTQFKYETLLYDIFALWHICSISFKRLFWVVDNICSQDNISFRETVALARTFSQYRFHNFCNTIRSITTGHFPLETISKECLISV